MSAITTHVLDTSRGTPAAGVPVLLEVLEASTTWRPVGRGATDADGRLRTLMPPGDALRVGVYRLTFTTVQYFEEIGLQPFFPRVVIEFETAAGQSHYHVPLLLSPFGYTTYRGS
jgi:5-hydroxyisourate hydrolase